MNLKQKTLALLIAAAFATGAQTAWAKGIGAGVAYNALLKTIGMDGAKGVGLGVVFSKVFDLPLNGESIGKIARKVSNSDYFIMKFKTWDSNSQVIYDKTNVNIPVAKK